MTRSDFRPLSIAEIAETGFRRFPAFRPRRPRVSRRLQTLAPEERLRALAEEPIPVGRVEDAYLAAVAEHLASLDRIEAPGWSEAPRRFLREPFFAGGLESLKAILIVESPSAFRRRLIFISADGRSRPNRGFATSGSAPALS